MRPRLLGDQWTRDIEFGIKVNCRIVNSRVTAFRHQTGSYTHAVDEVVQEWVTGYPTIQFRYLLACGDNRSQHRGCPMTGDQKITCRKCLHRLREEKK